MSQAPLLGRSRELDALRALVDAARAGSGGMAFVTGEPGIGKSRLADELARLATAAGVDVAWGRAWEAGGAPAYWPWIEVLRALLLGEDGEALLHGAAAPRLAPLVALLPELAQRLAAPPERASLPPEHARFAVLDAVAALLVAAARNKPRLCVLEDLHAADPASIELLDFVSDQVRAAPLLLLGTYRDVDAARAAGGPLLARVAGRAHSFALGRLPLADVASQLEQAAGRAPSAELAAEVHAVTEGNPLFVVEIARLIAARGAGHGPLAIPSSVRAALRERLARLAPSTHAVLEMAAVIGREFRRATLARMSGQPSAELAVPLADAADAAVLLEIAPGQYRFAHILFREVLHQDLPGERRAALHLLLAQALENDPAVAPASELAHHYFEAGAAGAARAIEHARRAAQDALAQFAFGEAARLLRLALDALEREPAHDVGGAHAAPLLLELGRAQVLAGEQAEGRDSCMLAAERARRAGDAPALARAALALGSVFVAGRVDPALVSLLREALARLGPDADIGLRARVMARLAAAEQPAREPREPIALARKAIALGREQSDAAVMLEVIRAACSAMIDFGDPVERLALNREHVALAESLGDRVEMLRATFRLSFDCYELGDVPAARAAIDRAERIAKELGHPHYAWRAASMQAMRAAFAGDFPQSEREQQRARDLAARAGDPNAPRTLLFQRLSLLRQQGRVDELRALVPEASRSFAGEETTVAFLDLLLLSARARCGEPGLGWEDSLVEVVRTFGDQTMLEAVAEVCWATSNTEIAALMLGRVTGPPDRFVHFGMYGMTWEGPISRALALLHATCGDMQAAERCFEAAFARVRELGSRTLLAWAAFDHGRFLLQREQPERASELLAIARELAAELQMPGLQAALANLPLAVQNVERAEAAPSPPEHAAPAAAAAAGVPRLDAFSMQREGELWLIAGRARSVRVKDGKGLRMLAELVREPGRELHVLELSEPGGASDTGDAGELIDARARDAYRQRIVGLRAEIEDAETANDLGRAEQRRAELELLTHELARAVGLGGRERRSGAATERARVNVQRRLRDAIRRIGEQDPELGRHLEWAIRTGTFCSYQPR